MARLVELAGWRRLAITGLCLATWRLLMQVPVFGLSPHYIAIRLDTINDSGLLHAVGSSGPFTSDSIGALGLSPYVNAVIVVSLLHVVSRRVQQIESSRGGRRQLQVGTRALAAALALGSAYGWTVLMQSDSALPSHMDWFLRLAICLQLAGGTMFLVWLGDLLDDFGLGFGYGVFLIYALGPLAIEVHRISDLLATAPSVEALYLPIAIWAGSTLVLAAATVGMLLAVRRIQVADDEAEPRQRPRELRLLMSGVLRPPTFATSLLFLPVIVANYYGAVNPGLARWFDDHLTAYGPNPWTDAAYAAAECLAIIAFTYFIVVTDMAGRPVPRAIITHLNLLTFVAGAFLALAVVVAPVLDWNATLSLGEGVPVSGTSVLLVTALILAAVVALEQSSRKGRHLPLLQSRVP